MQKRCNRNRKRSKRRAIYCPIHGCYLQSVSRRQPLLAPESRLEQGGCVQNILTIVATETNVLLKDEWLEAFWCDECQQTEWYHVKKVNVSDTNPHIAYEISKASRSDWQQSISAISPSDFLEKASLSAGIECNL